MSAAVSAPALAASYDLVYGGAYAAFSAATSTNDESFTGAGSWHKTVPVSPVVEMYIEPAVQFPGGAFTVGDITRIAYKTLNDGTNPSGVDFFIKIYTEPYTGGDATWYGNRLNAEPLYSNGYTPEVAPTWSGWDTDAGTNQLVFFDSNHTTNFGFYNGPTLQDLAAGSITWSSYPGAGAGSDPTPIDYATQTVKYIVLGTGSGWASFTGYMDAITIETTTDSYTIDLENYVSDVFVDDDWTGSLVGTEVEPGKYFGHNAFATIQDGVDNVVGSTVNVAAGTYVEQVIVDSDMEIIGAGAGATIIESPATLTTTFTTSADAYPVVTVIDTDDVTIRDLTVDGLGLGNANNRFYGVAFYNAGGALLDCVVTGIRETPLSGSQHGIGVFSFNNTAGPYTLEVGGCAIDDFQKNAMALSGDGMVVDVHDCDVTGSGDSSTIAQNGIQVSFGAGGTISNCTISAMRWVPATFVSSGILTFAPGSSVVTSGSNVITDTQAPVSWYDTDGTLGGLDITGGDFDGIFIYNSTVAAKPNGMSGRNSRPLPQVFGQEDHSGVPFVQKTSFSTTVTGSCVTGLDVAATDGIGVYSEGGPLAVTVTGCTISDFDVGLVLFDAVSTLTANGNSITSNLTAGYDNSGSGVPQDATLNWWGAADGPSGDGTGSGDAVLSVGGEVDFDPWLVDGTSSSSCAFTIADNLVEPDPDPADCVSGPTPCITVPFNITRSDNDDLRSFSVTFQLSSELQLCDVMTTSITEGTYLGAIGGTTFQLLDNGGGSYTVDSSILGLPCGATDPTGLLFSVDVEASGGDGTGAITVTSVTMRDCVNAPIPADAGGSATIPVDATAPVGMTSLSAAQVKTGNDTDGTTGVTVNWTPPGGDAATVEIYRHGFGFYPEYDDDGGAVPTPSGTPGGGGWAFVASVAAGAGTYTDETTTRDFWYYTAFVVDECDNVGAVSNMTAGQLNYHLGDVSDGITPGDGNNAVFLEDLSLLGANYGIALAPADPFNYLDVGPTSDFSVDALPDTDNQVQFEDLVMFAINYNQVSKEYTAPRPATSNEIVLSMADAVVGDVLEVELRMSGDGRIQALSVPLEWNSDRVQPIDFRSGGFMEAQGGTSMILSPRPGTVDAALFGVRSTGVAGNGVLATVSFHVKQAGDPSIRVGEITARNSENGPEYANGVLGVDPRTPTYSVSTLQSPRPNPFNPRTQFEFAVARAGRVQVRIYTLDGRLVTTLVDEHREVGVYSEQWSGRDRAGRAVASGAYVVRMLAPDRKQSRTVTLLK